MKVYDSKRWTTQSQRRGLWKEFAAMEWPACLQTPKIIFHSLSMPKVLLVRPGAADETCSRKHFLTFMNS